MNIRLLLVGAAVLMLQPSRSIGQSFVARSTTVPVLAPGQKVRVWSLEQVTFLGLPTPRLRELRIVGALSAYDPPDSLSLHRTALFVAPWRSREYTARWESVRRIDVPNGRQGALWGAGVGIAAAVSVGLMVTFMERLVSWDSPRLPHGHNVLTYSARAAIATVPLGVVVGLVATRWRRVY